MKYILIGLDDIDSFSGGCTTHFSTYVVEKILDLGGSLTDYPRLIRLNPDTPWKTRGNGAVAIEALLSRNCLNALLSWLEEYLHQYILLSNGLRPGTQPGIVILDGDLLKREDFKVIYRFSMKALYRILSFSELEEYLCFLDRAVVKCISPYGRRGLIGSLAAIGNYLPFDYTYELLIYRSLFERNRERKVRFHPRRDMEDEYTFAHVDLEDGRVIWSPHGPDPVIIGIRGDKPSSLLSILYRIKRYISYDRWMIFVTNQGTGEHMRPGSDEDNRLKPFSQYIGIFELRKKPIKEIGGHIRIKGITDDTHIDIMIYEPSGRLREFSNFFVREDKIILGGGVKSSKTENTCILNTQLVYHEKPYSSRIYTVKPLCPRCGSLMESLGRKSGYICTSCKYHVKHREEISIEKNIWHPQIALPPYRSIRHLSKPLKRYGREHRYRFKGLKSSVFFYLRDNKKALSTSSIIPAEEEKKTPSFL